MAERKLPPGFRKRGDGLEYRFTFAEGRHSVYGRSVKECYSKADETRQKLREGLNLRNGNVPLEKYFEEWLELKKPSVRETTILTNEKIFALARPYIGKKRLKEINRRDILTMQSALSKQLMTSSVNNVTILISSVLRSAVLDRLIPFNPADSVKHLKRTEPKATQTIHRAFTQEEQRQFFAKAKEKNIYLYELFLFLIQTGVRIGEASVLTWKDIDYHGKVIRITKTVTATKEGYIVGNMPKTSSGIRDIPMTSAIQSTLQAQRKKMMLIHGIKAVSKDSRIFLPERSPNAILRQPSAALSMNRILKELGIEKATVHAFRDTFATRAIEQGMPPNTLKAILGHSSISTTMDIYAHVMQDQAFESMQALNIEVS